TRTGSVPSSRSCHTPATSTCPEPATWWRATRTTRSRRPWSASSPRPMAAEDDDGPPVVGPIQDAIDLHPFAPAALPWVVESYVEAAGEAGFVEVRLIHGRGRGVQRARVRQVLSRHPLVVSYRDATPERGGFGATVVSLRQRGSVEPPVLRW